MGAFRVLWLTLKDLFDELFTLMFANLIWALISLPLLVLAFMLFANGSPVLAAIVALLAVLPLGPASAGMTLVADRVHEGRAVSWRLLFDGFRAPRVLSWKIYGLWMLGLILIFVNLSFYGQLASPVGAFLTVLFLYITAMWIGLLIYLGPLSHIQSDKRVRTIWRNALLIALARPLFTLVTLLLMGLIFMLSLMVPILAIFLTFALLTVWGFRATQQVVADAEARRAELAAKATATDDAPPPNTEKGRGGQIRPRK
jgi:uncharacterized membrane protein YesL